MVQSEDGSPTPENLEDGVVEPALEIEAGNANKDEEMEGVEQVLHIDTRTTGRVFINQIRQTNTDQLNNDFVFF